MAEPTNVAVRGGVATRVFWPSLAVIVVVSLLAILFPAQAESVVGSIQTNVIGAFGWYYVLLVAGFVTFALWVGLSRLGDIVLGSDDDEPEFRLGTWFSMLFAAGMGIGLVFWGVAEPLSHFASPKPGVTGTPETLAQTAVAQTYVHWGVHAWAIYVVVGLSLAYAIHRKGRPVSIRWALEPLLGDRVKGRLGDAIDVAALVGTVFGVATSLGLGVLQISAGLEHIGVIDSSVGVQVVLIVVIALLAMVSVVSGLDRGLKWLSNINVTTAGILMVVVLLLGPTLFLLREFVQSIGTYLAQVLPLTFNVSAFAGAEGEAWQAAWTTFYWGWWISWAPFVGVFIARISRGRTVRQFVVGVLLVPTLVTFLWFSVLGGSALYRELFGEGGLVGEDGSVVPENALFDLLGGLPWGSVLSVIAIVLIALFFITSSDSGSLVVAMLAAGGDPEPRTWNRVVWASLSGLLAVSLLVAGGLVALQTVAVLIALPFSVVMIGMVVATSRALGGEHREMVRAERLLLRARLTEHVSEQVASRVTAQVTSMLADSGQTSTEASTVPPTGPPGAPRAQAADAPFRERVARAARAVRRRDDRA
ncbi:BCCT family transporter [Actinotalea ferrariae]|uniref:BCCT family transporter n=1 Tax=Actinotalea ferrariae TaxID=1386098 RepID=UPI001C8BF3E0|nr:BCCT family transporter [Actinotalea ferrariae]MBX9244164.1 BCCT family transporter [Actinotalea ferrariae]